MDTGIAIVDGGSRVYILTGVPWSAEVPQLLSTSEHVETRNADTIPTGRVSEIEEQ